MRMSIYKKEAYGPHFDSGAVQKRIVLLNEIIFSIIQSAYHTCLQEYSRHILFFPFFLISSFFSQFMHSKDISSVIGCLIRCRTTVLCAVADCLPLLLATLTCILHVP
jgi:hypothetical protein